MSGLQGKGKLTYLLMAYLIATSARPQANAHGPIYGALTAPCREPPQHLRALLSRARAPASLLSAFARYFWDFPITSQLCENLVAFLPFTLCLCSNSPVSTLLYHRDTPSQSALTTRFFAKITLMPPAPRFACFSG